MSLATLFLRRHGARLVALGGVLALYQAAQLPKLEDGERAQMLRRFKFTRYALPALPDAGGQRYVRRVRPVHPHLERISGWISSVGAGAALADLDGDGLPNDACYVETRTDEVFVTPVPGVEPHDKAYRVFALDPAPLPYHAPSTAPTTCMAADLDEDGFADLAVFYWGRTPIAFLRDETVGGALRSESYRRVELVPGGPRWYTDAASSADVDGDGHVDLIVGNYFDDDSGILDAAADPRAPGPQMQDSMSRALNGGPNHILLCRPDAGLGVACRSAQDALPESVARGWTLAVGAADLDGDLLPEIYFGNDFGHDRLLHNRSRPGAPSFAILEGEKHLTTPNSKVLGRDSFKGMGVDFGDVDGDGRLDIYVSNIAAEYALQESHFLWIRTGDDAQMKAGRAPFVDRSEPLGLSRSGWAWESRLADFDNDGQLEAVQAVGFMKGEHNRWPELHEVAFGNDTLLHRPGAWHRFVPGDDLSGERGNAFFVRDRRGIFFDLAGDLGLGDSELARGIGTADVDGDGDLDMVVGNQWHPSVFYRNDLPQARPFLGLRLLLPVASGDGTTLVYDGLGAAPVRTLPAIGATVSVEVPDGARLGGPPGPRRLVGLVDGGNGHSGKRSPEVHFGLGSQPPGEPLKVELRWRDSEGRAWRETRWLKPGWHTVVLGRGSQEG